MKTNTKKLVGIALFTAIVIVLQLIGGGIKVGTFSVSLVLIPIVLGAALYGVGAGAWLGLVFGTTVLLTGDAAAFLAVDAFGTVATVLVKGTLAGTLSGFMYKAFEKKNKYAATAAAAVTCPIVNTGIFLIGCLLFFMPTITGWAEGLGFKSASQYMLTGFVGINFILEFAVNILLCPIIVRLINLGKKEIK